MPKNDPLRETREMTAAFVQEMKAAIPKLRRTLQKSDLIAYGKLFWPHSYKGAANETEAIEKLMAYAHVRAAAGVGARTAPELASLAQVAAMLYLPMEQLSYTWAACWADQVFPTITMGHKYASALMATSIPPEYADEVVPPFKAFLIEMPRGLVDVEDPAGGTVHAIYVLAHYYTPLEGPPHWSYVVLTDGPLTLWRHCIPTSALTEVAPDDLSTWEGYSFGLENTDHDTRVNILVGRLIVGVCLAMSSRDESKPLGKSHGTSEHVMRTTEEPMVRTFQVGSPISIDCRETIRDYLAGRGRTAPSVRKLVRGHWKRQPYGPQSSLRKWIRRDPFWRGPEGAPILASQIHLKDEEGG